MPCAPASPGSPLFCEQVPRSRANLSSGSCRRARALRPGVAGEPLPTAPAPDTLVPRRLHDSIPHLFSLPVSANHCRYAACCTCRALPHLLLSC